MNIKKEFDLSFWYWLILVGGLFADVAVTQYIGNSPQMKQMLLVIVAGGILYIALVNNITHRIPIANLPLVVSISIGFAGIWSLYNASYYQEQGDMVGFLIFWVFAAIMLLGSVLIEANSISLYYTYLKKYLNGFVNSERIEKLQGVTINNAVCGEYYIAVISTAKNRVCALVKAVGENEHIVHFEVLLVSQDLPDDFLGFRMHKVEGLDTRYHVSIADVADRLYALSGLSIGKYEIAVAEVR